jgi:hypothetical protein
VNVTMNLRVPGLAELLSDFQEGLCCMELITISIEYSLDRDNISWSYKPIRL